MTAAPQTITDYYQLLGLVHALLKPRTYLEIGVHEGHSLASVDPTTRIIGVDPDPELVDVPSNAIIVKATSDDFFDDPKALGTDPVDLAFIDGLHHWEQTLRDFANVERHCTPQTVVLIHDCNPIDEVTSRRERTTMIWSGDVWKAVVALRHFRPDLTVTTVDVAPTGLAIVTGTDPLNTLLFDSYDKIVAEIDPLEFSDLAELGRRSLLGLIPPDWAAIAALVKAGVR